MTTITAQIDPGLAKRVAKAADILRMTHEQIATEAIRLFVRSVSPDLRPARRKVKR